MLNFYDKLCFDGREKLYCDAQDIEREKKEAVLLLHMQQRHMKLFGG